MKKLIILSLNIVVLSFLSLLTSCGEDDNLVVEKDCGIVLTKIAALDHSIGSYISSDFSRDSSSNYEEAAIRIQVDDISGGFGCFSFTPIPQIISTINITSSTDLKSGGVEFDSGKSLNELFKIHNKEQTYSIIEFINIHTNDPLIFYMESDEVVLQLLNKPDATIDQSFIITFTFKDSEMINVETSNFEVSP